MRLYLPDDLAPVVGEAMKSYDDTDEYIRTFAAGVAKIVGKRPESYRLYGPYWWGLKKIILGLGLSGFDDFLDAEWLEKTDFGRPELNCAAAFAFQEALLDTREIPSNVVSLEDADGNFTDCVTVDHTLEMLVKMRVK